MVMNKEMYMDEIQLQLSDNTTYERVGLNPTKKIVSRISSVIQRYVESKIIDSKTASFLIKQDPVIPVFYILPKVHKSLEKPPGRPIVASTQSVLSPLAIYLHRILSPLVRLKGLFCWKLPTFSGRLKDWARYHRVVFG